MRDLNVGWLQQMVHTDAVLREKMTFFWHGHFACHIRQPYLMQMQNNTLRTHALGKFGDLLMAISKDAAMLNFLDNHKNRKDSPNENFAREVMELFTLGIGNYTENDIKNAARAFTGWQFNQQGEFYFNERQHDVGSKTIFGKTGNFTGEDVLRMLLENKQTARFITTKIYRYFANDQPDEKIIASLSNTFYQSDYDISKLMHEIFTSDWFYSEKNIGSRVKNPIELLVGLRTTFAIDFRSPQNQIFIQRVLGQLLFYPPNVSGWKEGKNWIDSSSLLFRMQLPELMFTSAESQIADKDDADVNLKYLSGKKGRTFQTNINWIPYTQAFTKVPQDKLLDTLTTYLLSYPLTEKQKNLVWQKADKRSQETLIRSISSALTSLPEYQLC